MSKKDKLKESKYDNGKRNPIVDDIGYTWCNCTKPKLTSNAGGRGTAFCLKCGTPYYH